ncbi:MAG: hypothetical protein IJR20_02085 [Muribaculaceae bacterium]|nr:hypothetical protein [Muribaculaceae bacterium]
MFKFKNFKILLLLMLFSFIGNKAWGNNWWCYQIEVDVKLVTGEGLVYDPDPGEVPGTIEVGEKNKNGGYSKSTQHSLGENRFYYQQHSPNVDNGGKGDEWVMKSAVPNTQNPDVSYIFKGWMYAGNAGDGAVVKHVSGNNAEFTVNEYLTESDYVESLGGYAFYAKTPNKCTYTGENGVSTGDQEHINAHNSNPPVYTNNAIIYALFEKQELTPAVTILYDVDNCEVEYPVDYQTNAIGNTITITARRKADTSDKGWEKEFVGWADEDGNIVSTDNPWTLNIEKKAVYRAVIEDRYRFFRIKNYGEPHRYVSAISDEASSNNFMDLMDNIELLRLNDNRNEIIYDAGSIVQIDVLKNPYQTSANYVDITVQNAKASNYYIFESGVTISNLPYDYTTKTWTFKAPLANFRDDSGTPKMQAIQDNYSKWIIEHLDLDLNTKENYFSLDPNKLVHVGDKYYTTLRTSWNILFNPEQMTPYIVKSVNETEGTFEMEPITGNIIPAGTPVIIETNSNDVEENRMVPTKTAANGAVPSGNLLQVSTKYFPNQPAPVSNCKGLYRNANGQLAFGGNALSTVNGNEAYLSVTNEVILPSKIPILSLADIERSGVIDKQYTIADQLIAVEYCQVGENDVYLWCKDQGNVSIDKSEIKEGQVDFMRQGGNNAPQKDEWDQSNWVVLKLTGPEGRNKAAEAVPTINGQKQKRFIKEKTVTGKYIDNKNFMIEVENNSFTIDEGEASYTPNVYATTNFLPENLNIWGDERDGGYTSGNPNQNYFFMNPKIQEVCTVTYAVWDGSKFVVPSSSGFTGSINVAWDYNEPLGVSEALTQATENSQVEIAYEFLAVVNRTDFGYGPNFETSKSNPDNSLLVYPLNLTASESSQVPTSIKDVICENKTVSHVVYYNLMGIESAVPHPGINIVVTEYSDGTRSAVKMIR